MTAPSRPLSRRRFATQAIALAGATTLGLPAMAAKARPEKESLKFGFIKLTDCAPLVVAYEKGFFEDEGLNVQLEAQANWKVLLDRVIDGQLDGAHMLAGQPLGATIGFGTKADIVTAFSMDLNGNGITVSNAVWAEMKPHLPMKDGKVQHPIKADALKKVVDAWKKEGKPFKMGMVFPVSTHNYELRYWLAAGGLNPGYYSASDTSGTTKADVLLSVTPPPQMPNTMEAGTIHGYCVGEPWNQQAVFKGIGVPVITDNEIWKNNPEKVFGVTGAWAKANPNTHVAVVKALIRAGQWLDASMANRVEAVKMLSKSQYVGADAAVIANSMTGTRIRKGRQAPRARLQRLLPQLRHSSFTATPSGTSPRCAAGARSPSPSPTAGTSTWPRRSINPRSTWRLPTPWLPKERSRLPTCSRPMASRAFRPVSSMGLTTTAASPTTTSPNSRSA
ncbi:MAG: CmpA/NrtA family ABC transporter substrate-binding protein [Burkholderiaceae bacterium]